MAGNVTNSTICWALRRIMHAHKHVQPTDLLSLVLSKFTIPAKDSYDKASHPSLSDISVDKRDNPYLLRVTIKQSKTGPFHRGVNIYLGTTDGLICPVVGTLNT